MNPQTRVFQIEARAADDGTVVASLASDHPVNRGGYIEVLDMSPGAVDLSRALDGLPLLSNHDARALIGRVHGVHLKDRRIRGRMQFFDTQGGRDAQAVVKAGHREVSIGYEVLKVERRGDTDLVTSWRPYEASIVSIPADPTVGINRAHPARKQHMDNHTDDTHDESATESLSRSQRRAARADDQRQGERSQRLANIAKSYSQFLQPDDLATAIAEGHTEERFQRLIMDRATTKPPEPIAFAPGFISQRGDALDYASRFSVARAIQARVEPAQFMRHAGFEAEIAQELQRGYRGISSTNGLLVPAEAFFGIAQQRGMTAGAAGFGGSFVQTSVPPLWIDALRARSVMLALGVTTVPLDGPTNLPKKTASTAVGWLAETGAASSTDIATGSLALSPKRVGAYSDVSKQLLITNAAAFDSMVRDDLSQSVLQELDNVGLNGTGASNQPRGIRNTSGIGSVVGGTNGAQIAWSHILDLEKSVDDANGMVNAAAVGYAINSSSRSFMKRTPRSGTNALDFVMRDRPNDEFGLNELNGYRCAVSSKMPKNLTKGTASGICSSLLFGDWSQLVVAVFGGGVEVVIDPYTLAKDGQIRLTANLFADIGVRQSASFAVMDDALTA